MSVGEVTLYIAPDGSVAVQIRADDVMGEPAKPTTAEDFSAVASAFNQAPYYLKEPASGRECKGRSKNR